MTKNNSKNGLFVPSRREFMLGLGAFGVSFGATGMDALSNQASGNKCERRLKIASIGCGGMGKGATDRLIAEGCDLVAICDIDSSMFDYWEQKFPGIPKFTDYREMLRLMGDKFEAVQVGTPDHTHAYISIDCMNAGKHVYVQKPLARTVEECELMLKVSLRTKRVVQMGNQGHPGVWRYKALRDACTWGEIKEIYSWSNRPIWPQGMKEYARVEPLPASVTADAWNCWCGPSADHGYSPAYHRFKWRGWWDYGCGAIGDMAVHNADPAFWAFELGLPVMVKADTFGEGPVSIAYPRKSRIEMTFAPNKWIPHGIKVVWMDGGVKPDMKSIAGLEAYAAKLAEANANKADKGGNSAAAQVPVTPTLPGNGLIIVGSNATSIGDSHAKRPICIAGDKTVFNATLKNGDSAARYDHYREFVKACVANDPEMCGSKLSYAAPLTEAFLIGCIALRFPGEELAFDPKAMQFTNKPEANVFLKASKRGEWDFFNLTKGRIG
jgi:predicted dehydrogenase